MAIAAAILLTPCVRAVAARTGAVDRPDCRRKRQIYPVPTLGGLAVLVAVITAVLASGLKNPTLSQLLPVLVSAVLVCLVGVYDDIWNLKPRWKFVGQILAVMPIVIAGDVVQRLSLLGWEIELGLLSKIFVALWLVSGINAVNFLDGMDGLGALAGVSISLGAAAIGGLTGRDDVILLGLIHAGGLIGFMVYNLPPARVYLGDSGSMLIGMIISYLALRAPQQSVGTLNFGVAIALMAIPILDSTLAILRRTLVGQNFWQGDRRHIHHCLLNRGMTTWRALRLLAGLFSVTVLAAYSAVAFENSAIAWATCLLTPIALYAGNFCCRLEWDLARKRLRRSLRAFGKGTQTESELAAHRASLLRFDETKRTIDNEESGAGRREASAA